MTDNVKLPASLKEEMHASFAFFRDEVSLHPDGYGLIRDRAPRERDFYSIASVGFGLAAYALGVERGWWDRETAAERVTRTFETFSHLDNYRGFYRHFYHADGRPYCFEYSTIDTAILLCGVHVAGNYFGGAVKEKADAMLAKTQWSAFLDENNLFHMAYDEKRGYFAKWDSYAEQLMMYVLGAASKTFGTGDKPYYAFRRDFGKYGDIEFCYTFTGSLFTHQFSHCFIDFRGRKDKQGMDWFENARLATLAARRFCIDTADDHPTYHKDCWGLTACDTPWGYRGNQGTPPYGRMGVKGEAAGKSLGVVPPAGALGSLPFCPEECLSALAYYDALPRLKGAYGLLDAFSTERNWYAKDVIGIDKGVTLLQAANLEDGFVWKYFNDSTMTGALETLGLVKE